MPTLLDVADRAGVSKSTASRALGHPQLVAPATVDRVLAAAMELGFVPNRAARELARGRTGVIAFVVPTLTNTFFTPIIGGAQDRAAGQDQQVTVAVNELETAEDLIRYQRLAQQVDGVVMVAPRCSDENLSPAVAVRPTVLVDRELEGTDSVVADTASAFVELLGALAESGHQKVAFLSGPDRSWQSGQRTRALRTVAGECGIDLSVLGPYPPTFAAGAGSVQAILETGAPVVLPYATDLGLGALFALHHVGRASWSASPEPGDPGVAVVGRPGAPMVDVDGAGLGRCAMDQLLTLLASTHRRAPAQPRNERLPVPVTWP
ncbi:LacI family DNA-binding transcriptional regulator [Ruania halotolerans]|uniref:LacI family DNA-binding transcriptional regulator n=1 Tax=Ruania halotolerans TaxID=2897773 RepID=UPI001E5B25D7|nr:LacI family DNA-binding transcriptional regulator [Ruania halotolerans]UFU06710.1 LacI family transcriptional regulator [Ruania halotolerans]